jgi:hypothetical protein
VTICPFTGAKILAVGAPELPVSVAVTATFCDVRPLEEHVIVAVSFTPSGVAAELTVTV